MLTDREQEILNIIVETPSITQKELADKIGIVRSSVAVHISNLVRKGAIRGREYIVQSTPYIIIIGGQNIDVIGKASLDVVLDESLPGHVSTTVGGPGLITAVHLKALSKDVKLISARGNDRYGEELSNFSKKNRIDSSNSIIDPLSQTAIDMYISDKNNQRVLTLSDMRVNDSITPSILRNHIELINNASCCVIDTNLPAETINFISDICTVPIFLDTVSASKTLRAKKILHKTKSIKCRVREAETLSGVKITDSASIKSAIKTILDFGVDSVFIISENKGIGYGDHTAIGFLDSIFTKILNSRSTGSAMLSAIILNEAMDIKTRAMLAMSAGTIAMKSEELVSPYFSMDELRDEMMRSFDIDISRFYEDYFAESKL